MDKLRYSGRGSARGAGSFVRGRGVVRGRGGARRASAAVAGRTGRGRMAWVRDDNYTTEINAAQESETTQQHTTSEASSTGPILSGPRNHGGRYSGRGRFPGRSFRGRGRGRNSYQIMQPPVQNRNTWKRDTADDGIAKVGQNSGSQETSSTAQDSLSNLLEKQEDDTANAASKPELKPNHSTLKESDSTVKLEASEEADMNKEIETVSSQTNVGSKQELKKVGRNKLVLPDRSTLKEKEPNEGNLLVTEGDQPNNSDATTHEGSAIAENAAEVRTMISRGNNQLVLAKGIPNQDPTDEARNPQNHSRGNNASARRSSNRGARNKRHASSTNGPTIKRVKIANAEAEADLLEVSGEGEKGKKQDADALTDFAYRSTVPSRPRGGRFFSRGRGSAGGRGKNMGLVRVNPDESNAPICPTFLRGIRCENERCTKRHDVPRESAMPVCSFFQRHGQCLKGADCPFRHVKVNPLATLCPSFNLLGYCDDETCVMKHVSANKSGKHTSRNGSSSKGRSP